MIADSATRGVGALGLGWALMGTEAMTALYELRWMLVFMMLLIMADFWWGCRELRMRRGKAEAAAERERYKFHFSRAGRRTLNKVVDYLTYLLLGCVIGFAVTEPLGVASHVTTAAIGVALGCVFELSSIMGHILATHDMRVRVDWKRFAVALVKAKSEPFADAVESGVEIGEDNKSNSNNSKKE